jgi:hypothetical protein
MASHQPETIKKVHIRCIGQSAASAHLLRRKSARESSIGHFAQATDEARFGGAVRSPPAKKPGTPDQTPTFSIGRHYELFRIRADG